VVAGSVLVITLGACTGAGSPAGGRPSAVRVTLTPGKEPTESRSAGASDVPGVPGDVPGVPGATGSGGPQWPVTLAFGGDVHFTDAVARLLAAPSTSLAELRPYFAGADVAMVNLETAITGRGSKAPKEFHFRTTPAALAALRSAGIDVVTMANNHAVDYGPVGLQDTLAAVRNSPVPVVVVYLHWGTDYTSCPNALQRRTAQALAEAGADVVLGSHAHRLQGGGWLGRTYVDYGLGNFVWWRSTGQDATTGVLALTVDRPAGATRPSVSKAAFTPLAVSADGVPRTMGVAASASAQASWQGLRTCSGLSGAPSNG
jgi:poly-gamma-glutamate synthesis protein (capsule biosynthesis protein)